LSYLNEYKSHNKLRGLIFLGYLYILLLYIIFPIIHNSTFVLALGFIVYWWFTNKKKIPNFKLHSQIMIVLIAIWVFVYPAILVYVFHVNTI
jgi:hypothetical protein